jgi:hypothetical protein
LALAGTASAQETPGCGYFDRSGCPPTNVAPVNVSAGQAAPTAPSSSGPLAFTGGDTLTVAGTGLALVLVGTALFVSSRRRTKPLADKVS